jgi:hypothetical protein
MCCLWKICIYQPEMGFGQGPDPHATFFGHEHNAISRGRDSPELSLLDAPAVLLGSRDAV